MLKSHCGALFGYVELHAPRHRDPRKKLLLFVSEVFDLYQKKMDFRARFQNQFDFLLKPVGLY